MARKAGKKRPAITSQRRSHQRDDAPRYHEAVETEAITLEPESDGEAVAGHDEPAGMALDHRTDDLSDQAVEQSRLPGLDDGEAPETSGGSLVPYDPLSRYLSELR